MLVVQSFRFGLVRPSLKCRTSSLTSATTHVRSRLKCPDCLWSKKKKKKATVHHKLSPGYLTQHQQRSAACLVQSTENLNDEKSFIVILWWCLGHFQKQNNDHVLEKFGGFGKCWRGVQSQQPSEALAECVKLLYEVNRRVKCHFLDVNFIILPQGRCHFWENSPTRDYNGFLRWIFLYLAATSTSLSNCPSSPSLPTSCQQPVVMPLH